MAKIVQARTPAGKADVQTNHAQAVHAEIPQAIAAPSQAEFNASVDLVNDLRQTLINAGLAK